MVNSCKIACVVFFQTILTTTTKNTLDTFSPLYEASLLVVRRSVEQIVSDDDFQTPNALVP